MNVLLPPRNFCAAEKRGTRLFFPAIAHKMHWCQEFFLGENKKRAPRGVLSSNEILAVFFKKNYSFLIGQFCLVMTRWILGIQRSTSQPIRSLYDR